MTASSAPSSAALASASMRALAGTIVQASSSGGPTATVLKAQVVNVHLTSTPSIDVYLSGDTSALVSGVTFSDSYTPFAGDTCWVIEQGNTIFALGQAAAGGAYTADGWTAVGTHGGPGGSPYCRLRMASGSLKVELQGTVAYGATLFTLPAGYAPSVTRPLLAACDNDFNVVRLSVAATTGVVTVTLSSPPTTDGSSSPGTNSASVGGTTGGASDSYSGSSTTGGASAGTAHTHGYGWSGGTSGHSHGFSGGSHSHTVNGHTHSISFSNTPTWVGLDGLSFYL